MINDAADVPTTLQLRHVDVVRSDVVDDVEEEIDVGVAPQAASGTHVGSHRARLTGRGLPDGMSMAVRNRCCSFR